MRCIKRLLSWKKCGGHCWMMQCWVDVYKSVHGSGSLQKFKASKTWNSKRKCCSCPDRFQQNILVARLARQLRPWLLVLLRLWPKPEQRLNKKVTNKTERHRPSRSHTLKSWTNNERHRTEQAINTTLHKTKCDLNVINWCTMMYVYIYI